MPINDHIILVCGVSGSGKSWVCRQLTDKFHYIPHDEHFRDHPGAMTRAKVKAGAKAMITECPFGERIFKEQLEARGFTVHPFFVIETPAIVARRYAEREGKPLPKPAQTRATTILLRADEWEAPRGTSAEVLELLREKFSLVIK